MTESRDYLELTFKSINCFADDGKLDEQELESLLDIALRDGVVDDNEKRVLRNIFDRLNSAELASALGEKVEEIKIKYF